MATLAPLASHALEGMSRLPAHCQPVDDLLLKLSAGLHICVPTYLAFFSSLLGTLSIVSWLFAQLPQIYKNYKIQSTAGLSVFFLVEWCLGDTANLVGALLTGQASWQVIIAAYYTFVDCILVGQYVWYERLGHGRKARRRLAAHKANGPHDNGPAGEASPLIVNGDGRSGHPAGTGNAARSQNTTTSQRNAQFSNFHFGTIGGSPREKSPADGEQRSKGRPIVRTVKATGSPSPSPHTLLLVACFCVALGRASPLAGPELAPYRPATISASETDDKAELAGRIIAWSSTALYLLSRLPQLIKNYRRKSTAGLSPTLFAAAFCGNLFYSSSLLTNPLAWGSYPPYGHNGWAGPGGSDRAEWLYSATPFFLGAFGVLIFDAAVGVQFAVYGDGRKGKYTAPIVVETPPTAEDPGEQRGRAGLGAAEPSRTRVLAVPRSVRRPGPGGGDDFGEPGSWRKVSGWMRGWVPSFSPDSFNRQGYMAAAAAAGRSARGWVTPGSRDGAGSYDGASSRSISRVRHEAEEWERSRDAGFEDDNDDRPLLEREDLPGSSGQYGSL